LLVLLIEGLALRRPPQRVATIHRTVADIALEQDWPVPSYSTVYAIVAVLNPGLRTPWASRASSTTGRCSA
jgi:putative transposase